MSRDHHGGPSPLRSRRVTDRSRRPPGGCERRRRWESARRPRRRGPGRCHGTRAPEVAAAGAPDRAGRAGDRARRRPGSSAARSVPRRARAPSIVAASASWRGSGCAPGSGKADGSTTIVARPPRGATDSSEGPASGNRRASRTAAPDRRSGQVEAGAGAPRRRPGRDEDDARAREERNATHAVADDTVAT